jgi:hypothetical protein
MSFGIKVSFHEATSANIQLSWPGTLPSFKTNYGLE